MTEICLVVLLCYKCCFFFFVLVLWKVYPFILNHWTNPVSDHEMNRRKKIFSRKKKDEGTLSQSLINHFCINSTKLNWIKLFGISIKIAVRIFSWLWEYLSIFFPILSKKFVHFVHFVQKICPFCPKKFVHFVHFEYLSILSKKFPRTKSYNHLFIVSELRLRIFNAPQATAPDQCHLSCPTQGQKGPNVRPPFFTKYLRIIPYYCPSVRNAKTIHSQTLNNLSLSHPTMTILNQN